MSTPIKTPADKDLIPLATKGNQATTGIRISREPTAGGSISIIVNGATYPITGDLLGAAYLSGDGGRTPRALTSVRARDALFWNGDNAGFDLDVSDVIDLDYMVS